MINAELMKKINIDGKFIGKDCPFYIIAEAGANHDGQLEKAFQLIDAALESGVDAIKFQNYTASKLTTKTAQKYWDDGNKKESQYDVFDKLDKLSNDDWKKIFDYAKQKGITCFSTPFDLDSVELLESFNVPAYKIASADITHIPLIKKIASKKKPIFMSTGMASLSEIHDAISTIKNEGNNEIILMHCITSYPTKPEDANLEMIKKLIQEFPECVVGYSDHTLGTEIASLSVFYGSTCIEKHFTFDKNLKVSRDHRLSLTPDDFKELKKKINLIEISRGSEIEDHIQVESEAVKYARRSIVSKSSISKGTEIKENMIDVKRPGTGILPKYFSKIIGAKALKDIPEDSIIQWDDIDCNQ
tara:strand:- start:1290 stop:2366 length:1077 start_codon:yes stop_codon:yes gene_type:complete